MINQNRNESLRFEFAKRLKALRERAGMTQKSLADVSEIHPVLIGRYENGHAFPRKENLQKLAIALNVAVSDLDVLSGKTDIATQAELIAFLKKYDIAAILSKTEKDKFELQAVNEGFPFSYLKFSNDSDTIQESIIIAEEETENLFKQSRNEYLKKRLLYHLIIKKAIELLPFYEEKMPETADELKIYLGIKKDY